MSMLCLSHSVPLKKGSVDPASENQIRWATGTCDWQCALSTGAPGLHSAHAPSVSGPTRAAGKETHCCRLCNSQVPELCLKTWPMPHTPYCLHFSDIETEAEGQLSKLLRSHGWEVVELGLEPGRCGSTTCCGVEPAPGMGTDLSRYPHPSFPAGSS